MISSATRTYEVRTYGCQMNVHDSERLSGLLEDAGYARAPEGDRVDVRRYRPGRFNVLAPHTFHRVELDRGPCWTLIATGPIVQSWGFWDRATGRYLPWREFVRAKGMVPRGEATVAGADAP